MVNLEWTIPEYKISEKSLDRLKLKVVVLLLLLHLEATRREVTKKGVMQEISPVPCGNSFFQYQWRTHNTWRQRCTRDYHLSG